LQRDPTVKERAILNRTYETHYQRYSNNSDAADAFCEIGQSPVAKGLKSTEVASYAAVARVIFNLHELVTRP